MPGKEQIVEEIGDSLLPNLVNQALTANDRVKYLMTLLQTAREQADNPHGQLSDLKQERMSSGVEEPAFDAVVQGSNQAEHGLYRIPEVVRIHEQIIDNLVTMMAPIQTAARVDSCNGHVTEYQQRFQDLTNQVPSWEPRELISGAYIDQITAAQPSAGDSVHLLVMDLHKELNHLQRRIASESIEGAGVYGVNDADRLLIAAFMRGVNRTRQLKLDHPGLDTTATRTDGKLVIQNDIGTTDAHVLVIHVTPAQVALTYADVHIQRLVFFQNMLKSFPIHWEDTRSRRSSKLVENLYHLCVGRYSATSDWRVGPLS